MGLFGFIGEVASATIKVAATPVAVLTDVASAAVGIEPENTKKLIKSAGKDVSKSFDEITGETTNF